MGMVGPNCTSGPGSQSRNSHFHLLSSHPSSVHLVNSYTTFKMAQASPPPRRSLTTHLDSSSTKDPGLRSLHSPSIIIIQDLPYSYSLLFEVLTLLHLCTPFPTPANKQVLHKWGFHIKSVLILEQRIHLEYVMQ